MLEMYEAYTDYRGMMKLAEDLVSTIAVELTGSTKITYQGTEVDLTPPWNRMTMLEAVKNPVCVNPTRELINIAKAHPYLSESLQVVVERKDMIYRLKPKDL
jgi:lysyl-tRNA synthetase class 2